MSKQKIVVVSKSYFDGMNKKLEELIACVGIHDFETMDKVLYLRKWLDASNVDREMRIQNPNLRWENIHLLLPRGDDCDGRCSLGTDNK